MDRGLLDTSRCGSTCNSCLSRVCLLPVGCRALAFLSHKSGGLARGRCDNAATLGPCGILMRSHTITLCSWLLFVLIIHILPDVFKAPMQDPLFYYLPPAPRSAGLRQLDPRGMVREPLRALGTWCLQWGLLHRTAGRQSVTWQSADGCLGHHRRGAVNSLGISAGEMRIRVTKTRPSKGAGRQVALWPWPRSVAGSLAPTR